MTITYRVGNGLYLNITNRCSNNCVFCVRNTSDTVGDAPSLWLPREPSLEEVWAAVAARNLPAYSELVFCGFGEPTERLEVLLTVAARSKQAEPHLPIRLNTNGQGNLIAGKDITPQFSGLIDEVSISLNAARAADYEAMCRPCRAGAFEAVLAFTRAAAMSVPRVVMSLVAGTLPPEDIAICHELASSCGAQLRIRGYIS